MSFTAQLLGDRAIYLVQGTGPTGDVWHYLQLDTAKKPAFLHALKEGSFDCAAFGTVLASGRGAMPPAHVQWEIEQLQDAH